MNIKIDSPLLWKLTAVIAICMLITCSTGCKFGKKLNKGSTGIHRVVKPSDLIQQPNGTFKLKPSAPIKSKPIVRSEPVRTPPEPIKIEPAKPTYKKEELKSAGTKKEFSPSVIDASNIRMNVVKNDKSDVKNTASVREGELSLSATKTEVKSGITIKYGELILFYLLGFLIMAFLYIIYDIYKAKQQKSSPKKANRKRKRSIKPKSS